MKRKQSEATFSKKLDLFKVPKTDVTQESRSTATFRPIASVSGTQPLEFNIESHDGFLNLNEARLEYRFTISKSDGSELGGISSTGKELAVPICNFANSMFSSIRVNVNGVDVNPVWNTYAYQSYIQKLLYQEIDPVENLEDFWVLDTPGEFNDIDVQVDTKKLKMKMKNLGALTRLEWFWGMRNKGVQVVTKIYDALFEQDKLIPPQTRISLMMSRSDSQFVYVGTHSDCKVKITDAVLYIPKISVAPAVGSAIASLMEKGNPAVFPIHRALAIPYNIGAGENGFTQDDLTKGEMPSRVVVGFLKSKAFVGNYQLNPFNFEHCNIEYLQLYINDQPIQPAFTPSFAEGEIRYTRDYCALIEGSRRPITLTDFPQGYSLWSFRTNPNEMNRHADVRLEVRFRDGLSEAYKCVVFLEVNDTIYINS